MLANLFLGGDVLNQRQIKLIKLLCKQNEYKPASFFSKTLSVSTKTIYSDLVDIEKFVDGKNATLIRLPRIGILLEASKEDKSKIKSLLKEKMDKYSVDFRRMQIIKRLFIESKTLSLESLAKEFFVSKSSLYNDIETISKQTGSDHLIMSDESGIYITGNELFVQKATKQSISYYLLHNKNENQSNLNLMELLFEDDVIRLVRQLLYQEYSELTKEVSDYYIYSLEITMIILLTRVKMGYHLEKENDFLFNNIRYMETYIVANSMIEFIKCEMNLIFTQEDVEFLCRQLFAHKITNRLKTDEMKFVPMVKQIIEQMEFIEKVSFDGDESLYHSLIYHLPAMIVRLKKGIRIHNPLVNDIKNQYSRLFAEVWYALSILESQYDVVLNDDEISLVLIYFQIALDEISKSNNIIIVCPYGNSSSQLILSRVKRFLPEKDHIEIVTIQKLKTIKLRNVDLIISPIDIDVGDVPIVKVSPLVNNDDIVHILEMYSSSVMEKDIKKAFENKVETFESPIIAKYLDEEFIDLQESFESKEECLDFMISKLENKGYVNDKFRESIINRERMGTTSLDTGVALPHADSGTINRSVISILTLKYPVRWGSVPVRLIVMMTLSTEDIDLFKDAIVELYQIINKKEYVQEIVEINEEKQMLLLFGK